MPSDRKLEEHRAIVDLCLQEAVSADWESTETLAHRSGLKHREAMWSALRLAEAGAIERREVTWRSARCRERIRSEYRLPFLDNCTATAQWHLFPPWLLPPLQAEPDPRFIKSILGKHIDITQDAFSMTDQELFELPRSVREHFQSLKDSQFADHPDVVAAEERLQERRRQHAANTSKISAFRLRIDQLLTQQRNVRIELAATADSRGEVFAKAFLAEQDPVAADSKVAERMRSLDQAILAIDKGMPHIQVAFNRLLEAGRTTAMQEEGDKDHLRGVIDRLKLAEAWRLYNS